jgi:hypothetical protein
MLRLYVLERLALSTKLLQHTQTQNFMKFFCLEKTLVENENSVRRRSSAIHVT